MQTDVLILGGGPAALAAAYQTASNGLKTCIAEESWSLGGQLRQQTQVLDLLPATVSGMRGYELGNELVKRLQPLGVDFLLHHTAIGIYADRSVGLSNEQEIIKVKSSAIIVATGAAETPIAFPGWTLPGVMTIGAAQIMLNRERVYPGKKALIIGCSSFALDVIQQMQDVGIQVVAVVQLGNREQPNESRILDERNIPLLLNTRVDRVHGSTQVEKVILTSNKNNDIYQELEVDLVCIDGGRHPILESFTMLNCGLSYQAELGGWLPRYNLHLETTETGIFVAGNAAGISCQAAMLSTGCLAGLSAAEYLNAADTPNFTEKKRSKWSELYRIESEKSPDVWDGRLMHIQQISNIKMPRNPEEWTDIDMHRRCYGGRNSDNLSM